MDKKPKQGQKRQPAMSLAELPEGTYEMVVLPVNEHPVDQTIRERAAEILRTDNATAEELEFCLKVIVRLLPK